MFRKRKNISKEFIPPRQEIRETSRLTAKDLIGGSIFSREIVIRQIPLFLFIAIMLIAYIGNQYRGEKIMKEVMALEKRVKELKAESATVTFELQKISTQSKVIQLVNDNGLLLEEAKEPPRKIIMEN